MAPSDEELIQLWKNPKFSGSFSGITNFRAALAVEKDIHVSKAKLFSILRKDPDILLETKKKLKKIPRRSMMVHGVGILWQCDLAEMHEINGKKYFLLCIDVYSHKLYCEALQTKSAKEVRNAFKKIFNVAQLKPEKIESDQGGEFRGNKVFFQQQKIFFKVKIGRNKASFAEYAIHLVKTRLYRLLRTLLSQNWPKYLGDIVKNINSSPNSALGGLRPVDIQHPVDAPTLDGKIGIPEDIPFEMQEMNQKAYEKKKSNIQKGDHVYVDFGPDLFEKGYDSPVSSLDTRTDTVIREYVRKGRGNGDNTLLEKCYPLPEQYPLAAENLWVFFAAGGGRRKIFCPRFPSPQPKK